MTASAAIVVVVVVSASVVPGDGRWWFVPLPRSTLAVDDAVVPVKFS